jgi:hypothetical protein
MSDYLNFSIRNRDELIAWIERQLGYPLVEVELTEDMFNDSINDAVEEYTRYVQQEREYIHFNLEDYGDCEGYTLPSNVASVFALEGQATSEGSTTMTGAENTLFSLPNQLFGSAGLFGGANGFGRAGTFITYEAAQQFIDLTKRMTASEFRFEYNQRTKKLTLYPDPHAYDLKGHVALGVNIIRPEDQQMGESWVKRYALALSKIKLGTIRAKFSGVQLLGGGNLDTSVREEGIKERDDLLEDLRLENITPAFFIG